jgi:hypothetical protein
MRRVVMLNVVVLYVVAPTPTAVEYFMAPSLARKY